MVMVAFSLVEWSQDIEHLKPDGWWTLLDVALVLAAFHLFSFASKYYGPDLRSGEALGSRVSTD
jgi:hypothetical protein